MAAAPSTANLPLPANTTEFTVSLACLEQGIESHILEEVLMPHPTGPGSISCLHLQLFPYAPSAMAITPALQRDDIAVQAADQFYFQWANEMPRMVRIAQRGAVAAAASHAVTFTC